MCSAYLAFGCLNETSTDSRHVAVYWQRGLLITIRIAGNTKISNNCCGYPDRKRPSRTVYDCQFFWKLSKTPDKHVHTYAILTSHRIRTITKICKTNEFHVRLSHWLTLLYYRPNSNIRKWGNVISPSQLRQLTHLRVSLFVWWFNSESLYSTSRW
jgi:hypothetical protein